ncbi:hypothetical protein EYF80_054005 [Liparis tanakae]|uniref:Uncharacterized protein n=1 Tax=Liparis tanakae TaxID=230148 RepID=A0A4Z2F4L9_9TELE|nr:hypothetical protein EYF80_054005 [Liparis tanakae]
MLRRKGRQEESPKGMLGNQEADSERLEPWKHRTRWSKRDPKNVISFPGLTAPHRSSPLLNAPDQQFVKELRHARTLQCGFHKWKLWRFNIPFGQTRRNDLPSSGSDTGKCCLQVPLRAKSYAHVYDGVENLKNIVAAEKTMFLLLLPPQGPTPHLPGGFGQVESVTKPPENPDRDHKFMGSGKSGTLLVLTPLALDRLKNSFSSQRDTPHIRSGVQSSVLKAKRGVDSPAGIQSSPICQEEHRNSREDDVPAAASSSRPDATFARRIRVDILQAGRGRSNLPDDVRNNTEDQQQGLMSPEELQRDPGSVRALWAHDATWETHFTASVDVDK